MATSILAPEPFLKWVGGKRWLTQKHARLLPDPATVQRLGLPFCGGGSIALHYTDVPVRLLSDTNGHLIATYEAVRDHVEALIETLASIEAGGYGPDQYRAIVERLNHEPDAPLVDRAAWVFVVIFWGYNGLWRVNSQGRVNVAFGKPSKAGTTPKLHDAAHLRACSRALAGATIAVLDFEEHVRRAEPRAGDFWYFDPPFVPKNKTANFVSYGPSRFSSPRAPTVQGDLFGTSPKKASDQERLAALLPLLDDAGARWALSNSDTPAARELYTRPGWNIVRLERNGTVSSKPSERGAVGEILVRNFV